MKRIIVTLVGLIILAVPSVWGQKAPEQTRAAGIMALTPQVSQGGLLVICADKDNIFDQEPGNSEVVFKLPKGTERSEKARSVSTDGRVISLQVPNDAQPGVLTIKSNSKEIGKVSISIVETSGFKCKMKLFMALSPAILFILFLLIGIIALAKNHWSLGEALSESEPLMENNAVLRDANNNLIFPKSASRLIAFIGLFCIITWIIGLSMPAFYRFAITGEFPDLSGVSTFILAQAGIFTPYIANKIAGAIKS
jgi:hypothetical protein